MTLDSIRVNNRSGFFEHFRLTNRMRLSRWSFNGLSDYVRTPSKIQDAVRVIFNSGLRAWSDGEGLRTLP